MTAPTSYNSVAKLLHWTIALFIIGLLGLGEFMTTPSLMEGLDHEAVYTIHKSFGILVLVLTFVRIVWRLTHPAPVLPATMPLWEKAAAHSIVLCFYIMMLVMPLSGWAISNLTHHAVVLFNVIPWPFLPGTETMGDALRQSLIPLAKDTHEIGANIMLALLALHVGAALKHHFIEKDTILTRMLPHFGK